MNDKDLHAYCIHWVEWRRSYYLYIPINPDSPPRQLYPLSKELDADQQEEMKIFDMAVATMKNMDQYKEIGDCFWLFYVRRAAQITLLAKKLGIARSTFYMRVRKAARIAYEIKLGLTHAQKEVESDLKTKLS